MSALLNKTVTPFFASKNMLIDWGGLVLSVLVSLFFNAWILTCSCGYVLINKFREASIIYTLKFSAHTPLFQNYTCMKRCCSFIKVFYLCALSSSNTFCLILFHWVTINWLVFSLLQYLLVSSYFYWMSNTVDFYSLGSGHFVFT